MPLEADNEGKLQENRPETRSILKTTPDKTAKCPLYQTAMNRSRATNPAPPSIKQTG
jgi:hypothetical protein